MMLGLESAVSGSASVTRNGLQIRNLKNDPAFFSAMPRFYLHVCNGHGFAEDHDGQELATEKEAREAAIRGAREVMAADVRQGELDLSSFIEVEDENRRLLFTVTFAEAIELKSEHRAPPSTSWRHRANS